MKENQQGMDWQDRVIIGSVIAGALIIAVVLIKPQSQRAILSNNTLSNSSQTATQSTAKSKNVLTESEAINILKGWYNAKSKIFAPPFSRSLVAQYTTGPLYQRILEKSEEGSKGSQGWLKDRGCYYTYDFSNIEKVWSFKESKVTPLLKIIIYERLQLKGSSSHGCNSPLETYRKNVTYWFQQDNGTWKIYEYKITDD
ncbi:ARC6/PARC6 family protein [Lyngbya sp. PCC 8106]|uniref:ARC6/PARC6 family protein n=1 Tax=Lyngbya sp. (strain PCC 8106) TaxID=313612 RepID=UPI0000EACE48|nr:ARC6/PARC6 family protein [Lyngbya sp. PCC 8106]EAW34807.1 hypothetical protein L8106_26332 [Lyngbya sp. PCC 8106]